MSSHASQGTDNVSEKYKPQNKRKRGIRASKTKLHQAMSSAGFKTQSALAEAIADTEDLDTVPKDMVSKVFREIAVEPSSIERIAKILGVDAFTLYLVKEEVKPKESTSAENIAAVTAQSISASQNKKPFFLYRIVSVLLIILVSYLAFHFISFPNVTSPDNPSTKFVTATPILGKFSIALVVSPTLNKYAEDLTEVLSPQFILAPTINQSISQDSFEVLHHLENTYQTDFVLKLDEQSFGNFFKLSAYLHHDNETLKIWESHNRYSHFTLNYQSYLQDLGDAISYSAGLKPSYKPKHSQFIDERAIKYYLEGKNLLDSSEDGLNVKSAQSRFTHAIEIDDKYAEAYAGLCESILHESWMDDEKSRLEDAQKACSSGMKLNPKNEYVVSTQAFFLRRTGRPNEAISLLNDFNSQHEQTLMTRYQLSYAEFEAYRHTPDIKSLIDSARKNAKLAIKLAPNFWKPYQILGLIEWTDGNTDESLSAFEKAVEHDGSVLVVTNLGTLHLCLNNLSSAERLYRKSVVMSPGSHLGAGRLGSLKYIQKNYAESLELRKEVLEQVGGEGIHQMWGALADSYLKTNQQNLAIEAYTQALTITERDFLRGNFTPFDSANRLYYKTQLALLSSENFSVSANDKEEIENLIHSAENLDSSAILSLALIASTNNNTKGASTLAKILSSRCPVYEIYPGLESIFNPQKKSTNTEAK